MFVEDKVALITGGASGIGFCYAVELLKNGLRAVTLADTDETKGAEAVAQIDKDFGADKVLFVRTDVSDKTQLESAFKKTVERFKNIDIVINNAGVMNDLIWEKQIAINLTGTIYGCLLAMEEYLPKYKTGDEGVIVNIASIFGLASVPLLPFYAATKHAVIGLSRGIGSPEHYNTTKVRVLTICPGGTATPLVTGLDKKMVNERYLGVYKARNWGELFPIQPVEEVPKCLLKILEEGANGSIWVAESGEIYEIEIPERKQLQKK